MALQGRSAACLADACNLEPLLYRHIAQDLGPLDILFLGMECEGSPLSWGYGHLLTQTIERKFDQARRDRGSNAAERNHVGTALRPERDLPASQEGLKPAAGGATSESRLHGGAVAPHKSGTR